MRQFTIAHLRRYFIQPAFGIVNAHTEYTTIHPRAKQNTVWKVLCSCTLGLWSTSSPLSSLYTSALLKIMFANLGTAEGPVLHYLLFPRDHAEHIPSKLLRSPRDKTLPGQTYTVINELFVIASMYY